MRRGMPMSTVRQMRVSIKNVAKEAGVSIATVSRIINNTAYPVSDELRERVLEAISKLHYQPCFSAQSLRTRVSSTIGLLVRDIADPYFASIAKGVTERALALSLMPLVCSTNRDPDLELRYLRLLSQYQVAGIVLAGAGWMDADHMQAMTGVVDMLVAQQIRLVACSPYEISIPTVSVDNEAVGRSAHAVLWGKGHRAFVVLGGQKNNLSSHLRVQGFLQAHAEKNCGTACTVLHQASYGRQGGYDAGCEAARLGGNSTAMFCVTDSIAIGALRGLADNGREAPHRMSVISVGDTEAAAFTSPALSTFRISLEDIGRRAVNLIVEEDGGERNHLLHTPFELVERESVRACALAN